MDAHDRAVADIARQVCHYHDLNQPFRISHGSTNSTRPRARGTATISTASLCNVIQINDESGTALVEPNVPMDALIGATMRHGLIPPVVMEFPGITVGGGYSGTSGESSSFKHGYFNETLNWVELVLGNGEIVRASPKEHADLFYGAAGACGTLGVMTLAEIQLVPTRTYVETTYHSVTSIAEGVRKVDAMTKDDTIDYLDGILFSPTNGVIVTGRLTDQPSSNGTRSVRTFTKASDPWFYHHVQRLASAELTNNELTASLPSTTANLKAAIGLPRSTSTAICTPSHRHTELIPTRSYLLRYDRGGFWVGRSAFRYFLDIIPFTGITRWFLDDFMRTRMLYKALHASGYSERYMIQDCAVPYDQAEDFITWCDEQTGIWPLWLCPLRAPKTVDDLGTFHPSSTNEHGSWRPMLNVGLWGIPPKSTLKNATSWMQLNQQLESKLQSLGGRKWLYAHSYYPSKQFWIIYGWNWYEELRNKYNATKLPTVWEKVSRKPVKEDHRASWSGLIWSIWPLIGLYGVGAAMFSGEFLKARGSWWHPHF